MTFVAACAAEGPRVVRVVDADTLVVEMPGGGRETIRLIGIDAPETSHPSRPPEHLAQEAHRRCEELVRTGPIVLESDALADDRDSYDRPLRYVRLHDGRSLNELLIREGWAFALTRFPFGRKEAFIAAEAEARAAGRGVWAEGGLAELRWILDQGRHPIEIFPASNRSWTIRFGDWVKPRVRTGKLIDELMRLVALEQSPSAADLEQALTDAGYRQPRDKAN